jgi:hypothetical protein
MTPDIKKDNDIDPLEKDFGREWGDDSLLDIEEDLEGLDDSGDLGVPGDSGDLVVPGKDAMDLVDGLEEELDELEEFMDSHWAKIIDE